MKLLDYSDPIEEFKKLNIEDKKGSQEDEDDLIHNLSNDLNKLNIKISKQLTERGKAKNEHNLEIRNGPYKRNDFGRHRNDSTDSGNCSDISISSPSSVSSESFITPFHENTYETKLVSLEGWQEKTESSQKLSPVRFETSTRFSSKEHIEEQPKLDLVSNKTEEQKEPAIISNSEEKNTNLENNIATVKETLEQRLNPTILKEKWINLIVLPKEDIFSTDPKGLTIFHRLLNEPEDEHLPETLYTIMEEFKQHPSKCRDLLNSKDAILKSLKAFKGNTKLLEDYFRISFIVISLLYDYKLRYSI